jgi:hypothetical protein
MRCESQPRVGLTDFMVGDESAIDEQVLHQAAPGTGEQLTIFHEDAELAGFLL